MSRAKFVLYFAWLVSLVASLGSLVFSEILRLPPCNLCWYQRIAMYPLVFILTTSLLRRDQAAPAYALPLASLGAFIAFYHFLLERGLVQESFTLCGTGVSCAESPLTLFGFASIPLLSLVAFLAIIASLVWYHYLTKPKSL
jgi:disulfide bond formation protein DsbB